MRTVLVDPKQPLFERYRAMFGLRNVGSEAAVLALADALVGDHSSALFRHEVAYVMGQLQHRAAVPALLKALQDRAEHAMVRHEAAEALGAIGDEELTALLKRFQVDEERIVRESCDVALDIMDYWRPAPAAAGH
jgi:deoxyhypusine monooxygenase